MKVNKGPCTKKHGDDYFDHLPAVNQRFWQGPQLYDILLGFACSVPGKSEQKILSQMLVGFMVMIYYGITILKKSPQKNKSKVTFWNICPAPPALTFPKQHWVSRPNQSSANARVTLFGKASVRWKRWLPLWGSKLKFAPPNNFNNVSTVYQSSKWN